MHLFAGYSMPGNINFYRQWELPYGKFSNFHEAALIIDSVEYPTSEHYFQAMKYTHDKEYFEFIRNANSPGEAAKLGRNRYRPMRADWEKIKDDVMMVALRAKFTQHPDLKELLLSTGNCTLTEHTSNDRYWGDGGDGSGKNMLGKLLVKLRDELK